MANPKTTSEAFSDLGEALGAMLAEVLKPIIDAAEEFLTYEQRCLMRHPLVLSHMIIFLLI